MTSVIGHLTGADFDQEHRQDWNYPPAEALFSAPVFTTVDKVCKLKILYRVTTN